LPNGKDTRFSKNVLIVAPGLTVRNRLSVLNPTDPENYYEEFNIVPSGLMDSLRQGKIKIINWHGLAWQTEEKIAKKKSVDKRGAKSDEAYVKEVLGDMANATNIIVINDEAHHAWRVPAESKIKGVKKEDIEESTVWVGGLRPHSTEQEEFCVVSIYRQHHLHQAEKKQVKKPCFLG
jgi:type III restriction enzyme